MFEEYLKQSWSKETSSDPQGWSPDNPSHGQCAITALIYQDNYGGFIHNMPVGLDEDVVSHYYNVVDDTVVDLTADQFKDVSLDYRFGKAKCGDFPSTREYILSYPETKKRYELLVDIFSSKTGNSQF